MLLNISELLQKEHKFNEALNYLAKLDRKRTYGYSDCGNGQRVIEIKFALAKANCYLNLLDTLSAISTLVEYCPFDEGEPSRELLVLLKPLLYSRYAKHEVEREIDKSIQNVEVSRVDRVVDGHVYNFERVVYTLFGIEIMGLNMTLKEFQSFISSNRSLEFLMER